MFRINVPQKGSNKNVIEQEFDKHDKKSFTSLLDLLNKYYHNGTNPLVSDLSYDNLLSEYETRFNCVYQKIGSLKAPDLVLSSSSKKRKSKEESKEEKKEQDIVRMKRLLSYTMSSLQKIKEEKQLKNWLSLNEENISEPKLMITNKIDGISALLDLYPSPTYFESETQHTVRLTTRGDGRIGFDISHLIPFIKNLPNIDSIRNFKDQAIKCIRMELVITKEDFKLVQELESNSEVNDARTTLSGIVNSIHPIPLLMRSKISCIAYEVFYKDVNLSCSIQDEMKDLQSLGFNVPDPLIVSQENISMSILYEMIKTRRESCISEMDGIVLNFAQYHRKKSLQEMELTRYQLSQYQEYVLSENMFASLTSTKRRYKKQKKITTEVKQEINNEEQEEVVGDHLQDKDIELPFYMAAIKLPPIPILATVSKVRWRITKYGTFFPTICFVPIKCGHVLIEKANGKSAKFIHNNIIGPGSVLQLIHSGDTIPDVVGRHQCSTKNVPDFPDPKIIPWLWNGTNVNIEVPLAQQESCKEISLARLIAFFHDLKAKHMGDKTVKALFDFFKGDWIKIFNSSVKDLLSISGFQQSKAENVHQSIQKTIKNIPLATLMSVSCVFGEGWGINRMESILSNNDYFPDLYNLEMDRVKRLHLGMDPETVVIKMQKEVDGINELAVQFVRRLPFFHLFLTTYPMITYKVSSSSSSNQSLTKQKANDEKKDQESTIKFPDQIVFSGFRDSNWEHLILKNGSKVSNSITKKTSMLVVATKNTGKGKETKAIALKIPILTKKEFAEMYLDDMVEE